MIGALCSISYGFAVQVLSVVYIQQDGGFEITNAKCYGIFVACVVTCCIICCLATKHAALLQTMSIIVNVFLILLFVIAVPAGKAHDFNSRGFIFGKFENFRDYGTVWSFALSWQPAIWTIGAFDSTIHCSEEAKTHKELFLLVSLGRFQHVGLLDGFFVSSVVHVLRMVMLRES